MPTEVTTLIYKFDELGDDAKEVAREWYRQGALDYEWWDFIYEDAKTIAELMGIHIDRIYFSGFWSQGDGACFEGNYYYNPGSVKAVKEYAPQDQELHRIATELYEIQREHCYKIYAGVRHSGHYHHEHCTVIEIDCDHCSSWIDDTAYECVADLLRDYMRWIYKMLETEYDWLMSDEQVDESIRYNGYEFTEDGEIV